eukprot:g6579.t1
MCPGPLHVAVSGCESLDDGANLDLVAARAMLTQPSLTAEELKYMLNEQECCRWNPESVRLLLDAGAAPNTLDGLRDDETRKCMTWSNMIFTVPGAAVELSPLLAASAACDFDCVRLLLEAGANPNICNRLGFTPLALACLADNGRADVSCANLDFAPEELADMDISKLQRDDGINGPQWDSFWHVQTTSAVLPTLFGQPVLSLDDAIARRRAVTAEDIVLAKKLKQAWKAGHKDECAKKV